MLKKDNQGIKLAEEKSMQVEISPHLHQQIVAGNIEKANFREKRNKLKHLPSVGTSEFSFYKAISAQNMQPEVKQAPSKASASERVLSNEKQFVCG